MYTLSMKLGTSQDDTVELDIDNLWLDCWSITKKEFDELFTLRDSLAKEGYFNGDRDKCLVLAVGIWVELGNGIREATDS